MRTINTIEAIKMRRKGIKAALKVLGICEENVRLPLVNVRPEIFKAIEHETHTLKRFHFKA
jgi:dihydrodipicolinate synthase/N-acetylneuraminate lyase